ncbi:hypothetical protein [Synergistes jonesii]|uniref:GLUG domain-containing protein n=1 Tax=Synergistes jonesii TaxID=2754 RepID=A0A073ING4_9BACT|nr:hypothetical protein [Synergistes jonesii]KEJ91299.1 hypothetical protein EH55_11400 [Synergistes jonesii]OFB60371.1 hypothetical protein JS73_12240 [Synergistes jonesii]OFB61097.1 hypothetical protein JS79_12390 [Synergistes jonesii]OFB65852.1 hypothetical protein JS72_00905 [Synergistes jonesii]OFB66582.1 hypothetical protein JS78_12260 [Synergistes jonesii]
MLIRKITFHIILAALLLFAGAASAANWIESADIGWYEANSADATFTINTAEELAGLAKLVNDGTEQFEGKTVKLASDIDLSGGTWTAIGHRTKTGWQLLHCFRGTFDGCGHKVSGLGEIKNPISDGISYISYIGLFGYCEAVYPVFKNLHIEGDIRPSQADKDAGSVGFYIGGLLGATQATANGTINKTIENCSFSGKISSDSHGHVGGISGMSWCSFLNCYVSADISLSYDATVGGVVGEAGRAVENCGFTGSIVLTAPGDASLGGTSYIGGIAGWIHTVGSMTNCASFCDMNIKTAQSAQIGGVAGNLWASNAIVACTGEGKITASAAEGKRLYVGGVVGYTNNILFEYCSSAVSISAPSAMIGGLIGHGARISTFTGCEWLGGDGRAEEAVGDIDEITDEQALKVIEAKNLRAASVILPPIYKVVENIPTTIKALVFPTNCGDMGELGFSWGTSDKSALSVAYSSDTAVIRSGKSGTTELYLSASGFPGGNSWSLKAVVLSVLSSLQELLLSAEEIILKSAGASEEVAASITPESGVSYPELKWSYEVISGDAATTDDLEITYIESTRRVKVTLVNFVEGARYKLTAKAVDGTGLSASLTVTAKADTVTPGGGSSGGCSTVACGPIVLLALLLPAAFMAVSVRRGCRK